MVSTLSSENCLTNRRYAHNINRYRQPDQVVLEIPQQNLFFNYGTTDIIHKAAYSFAEELKKNGSRLQRSLLQDLASSFSKLLYCFLEVNATAIYSQITSLNSLVMKAETPKDKVYVEVFFDEVTGWTSETVVNIFQNQQMQLNNSGPLDTVIFAIKQYFGNDEMNYFTILNHVAIFDIPTRAFTTTDF